MKVPDKNTVETTERVRQWTVEVFLKDFVHVFCINVLTQILIHLSTRKKKFLRDPLRTKRKNFGNNTEEFWKNVRRISKEAVCIDKKNLKYICRAETFLNKTLKEFFFKLSDEFLKELSSDSTKMLQSNFKEISEKKKINSRTFYGRIFEWINGITNNSYFW